jgi:hypothetical protein
LPGTPPQPTTIAAGTRMAHSTMRAWSLCFIFRARVAMVV